MKKNIENYIPFMSWTIEVAEEKILEHRLLKENFESHQEFIIFTIIWLRVYKSIYQEIKNNKLSCRPKDNQLSTDTYIKNFYKNQNNKFLGITINAISRESEIPRSTVKRYVEKLINKNLVIRNNNNLIIPTTNVRDKMANYRKYIFDSSKTLSKLFQELDLETRYFSEEDL